MASIDWTKKGRQMAPFQKHMLKNYFLTFAFTFSTNSAVGLKEGM